MHFKCCFLYLFVFKYVQTCLNYNSNIFYKNSNNPPRGAGGRVLVGGSGAGEGCGGSSAAVELAGEGAGGIEMEGDRDRDGGGIEIEMEGDRDQVSS